MDLNDKIAARRREVEQERLRAQEAESVRQREEVARQKAEFARQMEERRVAQEQEAAAIQKQRESIAQQSYVASSKPIKTVDIELESALIGESLERVTKTEMVVFIIVAFISLANLFNQQYLHAMGWGVAALAHLSYVVRKHRRAILANAGNTTKVDTQKEDTSKQEPL